MGLPMNRFDIMNYISERYDVEPQYLWDTYPDYAVFRHPGNGKWFAVIMNVDTTSVDIKQEGPRSMVNSTECDLLRRTQKMWIFIKHKRAMAPPIT